MNPWTPDDNAYQARRIGKTDEEVGELASALAASRTAEQRATQPPAIPAAPAVQASGERNNG